MPYWVSSVKFLCFTGWLSGKPCLEWLRIDSKHDQLKSSKSKHANIQL